MSIASDAALRLRQNSQRILLDSKCLDLEAQQEGA